MPRSNGNAIAAMCGETPAAVAVLGLLSILAIGGCGGGSGGGAAGGTMGTSPAAPFHVVTVSPASDRIPEGSTRQFTATDNNFTDGTSEDVTSSATWISADTSSVTIDASGLATGVGVGYSLITARSPRGDEGSTVLSVTATILTVSTTLTPGSSSVTLPNMATADFAGESSLMGQAVSLAAVIDPALNALASDSQTNLGADLSDPDTIQITTPLPPSGSVRLTANVNANRGTALFVYSPARGPGEIADTITPLPVAFDSAANTVTASVPGVYFQQNGSGTYVARLKIGVTAAR